MEMEILHPRPSAIVAALFTLRDFDVDVIVIHGPPGCCFKHSRLLEEDGVRVVTTAMDEQSFVFGGRDSLISTLKRVKELFQPQKIGITGTCASMIIGEDINDAIREANVGVPTIPVEIHAGHKDNTAGVIAVLESALKQGFIDENEFKRQKDMMIAATELEKECGSACDEYIPPSFGDPKIKIADRIVELIKSGKKGAVILNAKKETVYMFSDVLVAVYEVGEKYNGEIISFANLDENVGLARIRRYARDISNELKKKGIGIDYITGGLDEYPIAGKRASDIINTSKDIAFMIAIGIPQAIDIREKEVEKIAVTNGPREVEPLKNRLHYSLVDVELELHAKTMGARKIIPCELGETIREKLKEQ
jgi:putative methanogenesis marker 13 metalloprotein